MADIGIGIIGAGRVATYHLQALANTPEASVIAIYDVVPERAFETAAAYDVPHVAPTLEDLLDRREIEAVIVATPPVAHREHTTMALAAGKHVSMREAVRSKMPPRLRKCWRPPRSRGAS